MIKFGSLNVKDIRIGEQQVKKVAFGSEVIWEKSVSPLPSGYTEVKYLQSSGTQYINTGVYPNVNVKTEISFRRITTQMTSYLFGSTAGRGGTDYYGLNLYNNQFEIYFGSGYDYQKINGSVVNTDYVLIANDNKKWLIDGDVVKDYSTSSNRFNFEEAQTIWLFTLHHTPATPKYTQRIYYCKMWENDSPILDFIPCLDTNNTPCFYDTVTQQTFYNQGTGEFGYETMDGTVVAPT